MYQIIYIDIDEEITSVIDKLRKTKTKQVFLSVPNRALILQSIVSLKLLRKEADKLEREIILVTPDEKERKLSEKADIETRETLEGLDTVGEMKESVVPKIEERAVTERRARGASKKRTRKSMEEIGSSDFYDVAADAIGEPDWEQAEIPSGPKRMMVEVAREQKRFANRPRLPEPEEGGDEPDEMRLSPDLRKKEELVGGLFQERAPLGMRREKPKQSPAKPEHIPVSRKIGKVLLVIIGLAIVLFGVAAAYVFVPQAEVALLIRNRSLEKDLEIRGETGRDQADPGQKIIPARAVEKEGTFTFSYPVTGKGSAQGQKARGTVTIYNEYSSAAQPLVATTRLVTPDKKIFRLVKGVTVPGMTEISGKSQPGAIEAEVVADEPGEEYNIEPATFKIPGFEGGQKYDKFYARSTAKMTGGSSSGESSGAQSVAQSDITLAKNKAEESAREKIGEELKATLAEGEIYSANISEETIVESAALARIGDTVSNLQYRVTIRKKTLVFSAEDVRKIVVSEFGLEGAENIADIDLDFGAISGDMAAGTVAIKVHGRVTLKQEVDAEKIKEELSGKGRDEIEEVIKRYPQIEEMEINIYPELLFDKMPQIPGRINVTVQN